MPPRTASKSNSTSSQSYQRMSDDSQNGRPPSGQPQHEFFATADQALCFHELLFLKFGRAWHRRAEQFDGRLLKINDRKALAEELYLTIYTRRPSEEEAAMVFDL